MNASIPFTQENKILSSFQKKKKFRGKAINISYNITDFLANKLTNVNKKANTNIPPKTDYN